MCLKLFSRGFTYGLKIDILFTTGKRSDPLVQPIGSSWTFAWRRCHRNTCGRVIWRFIAYWTVLLLSPCRRLLEWEGLFFNTVKFKHSVFGLGPKIQQMREDGMCLHKSMDIFLYVFGRLTPVTRSTFFFVDLWNIYKWCLLLVSRVDIVLV